MLLATKTVSDVRAAYLDVLHSPTSRSLVVFDTLEAHRLGDGASCTSTLVEVISSPRETVLLSEALAICGTRAEAIIVVGTVRCDAVIPEGFIVYQICESSGRGTDKRHDLLPPR